MRVELQRVVLAFVQPLRLVARPARAAAVAIVDVDDAQASIVRQLGEALALVVLPADAEAQQVRAGAPWLCSRAEWEQLRIAVGGDLDEYRVHV